MQTFTYPFKVMNISQNYSEGNHKPHNSNKTGSKDYPIDDAERDTGRSPCYARVDLKVIKKYTEPNTNAIVLETTEKVITPSGEKKLYLSLSHPNDDDMKNVKVGQIIKKGNIITREGNDYPSSGNHLHITIGEAPYKGLYKNSNGSYCFTGAKSLKPEEAFFIDEDFTTIKNSRGIKFKKLEKTTSNNYKCNFNMYVRTGAGTNHSVKLVKDLTKNGKENATSKNPNDYAIYKKDTIFTALEIIKNKYGEWAKTPSGYVCLTGASGSKYCSKC
jgi:hypothetical protein